MFFPHAADADIPEVSPARPDHRPLERRDPRLSTPPAAPPTGRTEAVNLLVEKIRRVDHGYRNFDNYRRRLLLGCGITWTTVPVSQNPRPQPAFAASSR